LVREGALGRAAARRARGDYLPEALLLAFLAMAGTGTWAPPEIVLADVAARTVLSMALFLALPALLVSVPLELERAPLLSWRAPRARAWLALPVLVAGTLTLGGLLWRLGVTLFPSEDVLAAYRDSLGAFDGVAGLVAVSVVPGICEELLFRGAILGLLRHRFPAWGAILIQALCFALLHALAVRLPYTFALGVVFGVLVVRTGSLWPAIVAHAAHNFLATQIPADRMDAWLDHPAAWGVAALAPAAAWFAGRKTAGRP
ncbi:MAG: type II CAAX prenyl endopeptidase Rce1 family protein, partial [Myxococcota bacterium]